MATQKQKKSTPKATGTPKAKEAVPTKQRSHWGGYPVGIGRAFDKMHDVEPLTALRDIPDTLTTTDRHAIISQAEFGLRNLYAHLPLKRARHATDPLQALHLFRHRMSRLSDQRFHADMMRIFSSLGDIHTAYRPPEPYTKMIAFLPFMAERYFVDDHAGRRKPRYVVTGMLQGFEDDVFRRGVELISWNGVPIDEAVATNGRAMDGSNPDATMALSVQYLTIRWLGATPPPQEQWVMFGFEAEGKEHEIRLPWALLTLDDSVRDFEVAEQAVWLLQSTEGPALDSCINAQVHLEHLARRRLFAPKKLEDSVAHLKEDHDELAKLTKAEEKAPAPPPLAEATDPEPGPIRTHLPAMFEARVLDGDEYLYGYIRIRGFVADQNRFVAEFRRLVSLMPRHGLILDIRGNPGGIIQCAERCLQFLTPRFVRPLPFQFLGTRLTDTITNPPADLEGQIREKRDEYREAWGESINVALHTGGLFSKGAPLTPPAVANSIGQTYHGPTVLITDAITYSSGDIFAAGFQDVEVGKILGVDSTTGAGGANLWSHAQLVQMLPDVPDVQPLPAGVEMTYAARRCLRGGPHRGMPVEELGVKPDVRHWTTRDDVMEGNKDLLAAAMAIIDEAPKRALGVTIHRRKASIGVTVRTEGLDRIDFYLGDRPISSHDVDEGETYEGQLDLPGDTQTNLTVKGYADGKLVAASREPVTH